MPRKKSSLPPARTRGSEKKGVAAANNSDADSGQESADEGGDAGKKMKWTESLTWSLISAIESDKGIKRALYPPPGSNASTARGGGKAKTEFHAELARVLFEDDEKYGAAFTLAASEPKGLAAWGRKVKSRISFLEKSTRTYMQEMGETGKGITAEEELDMSQDNTLTNKWALIKVEFPYLWNMKALIMQRPNIVRTGIGNSEGGVDLGVILPGHGGNEVEGGAEDEENPMFGGDGDQQAGADTDEVAVVAAVTPRKSRKRKSARATSDFDYSSSSDGDNEGEELARAIHLDSESNTNTTGTPKPASKTVNLTKSTTTRQPGKKTPARSGTSTPAPKGAATKPSLKKLKYSEQFSDMALAEEATKQKSLELQLARTDVEKEKVAAKLERSRLKLELAKMKMAQEHEMALETMKYKLAMKTHTHTPSGSSLPTPARLQTEQFATPSTASSSPSVVQDLDPLLRPLNTKLSARDEECGQYAPPLPSFNSDSDGYFGMEMNGADMGGMMYQGDGMGANGCSE